MALTEKQTEALRDLRAVTNPTSIEAGRAEALMRFASPSPGEQADLRSVLSRYKPRTVTPTPEDSGGGDSSDPLWEALEKHPEADGRVVRALVLAGVRPDKLDRAVQLASVAFDEPPTRQQADAEAAQLRQDAPDMFGGPAPRQTPGRSGPGDGRPGSQPPKTRPAGTSAKDAGAALALERGWTKPDTSGDAA